MRSVRIGMMWVFVAALGGCGAGGGTSSEGIASQSETERIARGLLDAMRSAVRNDDPEGLYALFSSRSRLLTPYPDFYRWYDSNRGSLGYWASIAQFSAAVRPAPEEGIIDFTVSTGNRGTEKWAALREDGRWRLVALYESLPIRDLKLNWIMEQAELAERAARQER